MTRVAEQVSKVSGQKDFAGKLLAGVSPGAVVRFLEKPFTIDTLMAAVEGILAAERGPAA